LRVESLGLRDSFEVDSAACGGVKKKLQTCYSKPTTDTNRRPSERRAELVRAMLSEKEEDEVKISTLNSKLKNFLAMGNFYYFLKSADSFNVSF
jgi:hypothetical protein